MRRFCLAVAPLVLATVVGCENGPTQTFSQAVPDAGSVWNNGNTPPVVQDGNQPFGSAYPTTGKTTICSTDIKRQRWGWMLQQPVIPPRFYAGIDMAKDDLWHGLTIDDAESPPLTDPNSPGGGLCQSVPAGYIGQCGSGFGNCNQNYWGNNAEVIFNWNLANHFVDQMELQLGYLGAMTMKSKDLKHTYVIKVGDVIKKDDQPFLIDWNGKPYVQITELYNAAIATFGPASGLAADVESTNCQAEGNCLVFNGGGQTIFGFRPLIIYVQGNSGLPQPALSTPVLFYNFFSKFEPYGYLPQQLKMDAEGPVAIGNPRGAADKNLICTQKVGLQFGDFRKTCIQVHGANGVPDMIDTVNLNKILNGLGHDQEHWAANVVGVNQNFTSEKVATSPDLVVLDSDTPQDGDFAQDFFFDLRARGHVQNDYNPKDKLDLRGSALVYNEWARLMLNDINQQLKAAGRIPANQAPKKLGDPDCTGFDGNGNPNFKPGCSGIEGLIIPAWPGRTDFSKDASCANAATCLNPGATGSFDYGVAFYGASVLKPGDHQAGFCVDPGADSDCYISGSYAFSALAWVTRMMGNGNINNLLPELRDRRYYFKWYAVAHVKYMKAYSDFKDVANRDLMPCSKLVDNTCKPGGPGPSDVAAQFIDQESLFFDNNEQGGSNSFDKFEYIDREYIGKGQEGTAAQKYNWVPWDFEYGNDLIGGNQRYDNWFRRMDREEIAMFSAMLVDKRHTPGQENNVNITNLFGSGLLPSVWPDYACATGTAGDPATNECGGTPPPLDSTNMTACTPNGACDGSKPCQGSCGVNGLCIQAKTYETGIETVCGTACDFKNFPKSGCAKANQTCVISAADNFTEACVDMMMDLNGATGPSPHPVLYYYPSAWSRTPFAVGHSPITVHQADKHPTIGVAKATIPNFVDGPYTNSPQVSTLDANQKPVCPANWKVDATGQFCNAPLNAGTGMLAPSYTPLIPWLEVQPGVGFSFPLDAQHDQVVTTGQLDFTGVLETYNIDYVPWVDGHKPSCALGNMTCNTGYTCNPTSKACEASDDTIQILAIESADFLGETFLCQDPKTGDVLHVRQYDSAISIINWLAAHPGGWDPVAQGIQSSAQSACGIIIKYSPNNGYIDYITSKVYGVKLAINQGAGLGRVIDATLYDSSIPQTP